jgi:putative flippase GtrA
MTATAVAVEAAVLHNFSWHQRWTWHDRPVTSWRSCASRLVRFQMLNGGISLFGNMLVMWLLAGVPGIPPIGANIVAIATCAAINFAASEAIVFRPAATVLLGSLLLLNAPAAATAQPAGARAGWDEYEASVDARYNSRRPGEPFFVQDRKHREGWRERVREGGIEIREVEGPPIPDGRIHHWVGAVFVPGTTVDALVTRLEAAAGTESQFYDDVLASKLLAHDGDRVRIFLKLRRTALITVTYNTEHTVEYRRLDVHRASARSTATKIAELSDPGTAREREKAPGDDNGFLWRLNAYWRYEAWGGGVLIECESVSLSRPVPLLLRPIAGPIVDRIARESLDRTLRSLRGMLSLPDRSREPALMAPQGTGLKNTGRLPDQIDPQGLLPPWVMRSDRSEAEVTPGIPCPRVTVTLPRPSQGVPGCQRPWWISGSSLLCS